MKQKPSAGKLAKELMYWLAVKSKEHDAQDVFLACYSAVVYAEQALREEKFTEGQISQLKHDIDAEFFRWKTKTVSGGRT